MHLTLVATICSIWRYGILLMSSKFHCHGHQFLERIWPVFTRDAIQMHPYSCPIAEHGKFISCQAVNNLSFSRGQFLNQGLIHNAQPKSCNTRYSMYESEVHSPIKIFKCCPKRFGLRSCSVPATQGAPPFYGIVPFNFICKNAYSKHPLT